MHAATLPFFQKNVKIVFFVRTSGIFHFLKIRLQFFINSSQTVVFSIQIF